MSIITFPDLPPEMWTKIYCYCKITDLISVACCSKACYAAVKRLLWRVVKVEWKFLENKTVTQERTKHLEYTNKLYFCGDGFFANSVDKSYEAVIRQCDPIRLRSLYLIRYPTQGNYPYLKFAAELLTNLREMWLSNIYDVNLSDVCCFTQLQKLSICDSNLPDDNLEEIDNLAHLEELFISNCSQLTEDVLEHISFVENLKKLTFAEPHRDIHTDYYIDPVDRLTNLVDLNLSHSSIKDSFFEAVSREVVHRMLVLNIQRCYMLTDAALTHVARWPVLEMLNISHCNRFTNNGISHFTQRCPHVKRSLHTITVRGCVKLSEDGLKGLRDIGIKVVK